MLRRTQKLAKPLPISPGASAQPILLPARDVASLPVRLPEIVAARLRRLGIPSAIANAEVDAMHPIAVGPTADRSVVGIMVDFAFAVPHYLDPGAWDDSTLAFVEARLAHTPCHASKRWELVVFPDKKAPELLSARWGAA